MFGVFGDDLPPGDPLTWNRPAAAQQTFRVTPLLKSSRLAPMLTTTAPASDSPAISPLVAGGAGVGIGFILGFLIRRRR